MESRDSSSKNLLSWLLKRDAPIQKPAGDDERLRGGVSSSLIEMARSDLKTVYQALGTSQAGLTDEDASQRRERTGLNEIADKTPPRWYWELLKAFSNPVGILLLVLALVSLATGDHKAALIILTMVVFGTLLRFSLEYRSNVAAAKLKEMVLSRAEVCRPLTSDLKGAEHVSEGGESSNHKAGGSKELHLQQIPIKLLVPGDVVHLSAGDMIPADTRLISARDLFVSQGTLTGESLPVEKHAELPAADFASQNPLELPNLCFMGTTVVSGTGLAIVVKTGKSTYFGAIAEKLVSKKPETSFEKGVNGVGRLLLRFMLVMAPLVFLINGTLKGNWTEAFFFALSVAVGLAPEMLPMIVSANLAKGAIAMSDQKVIVKNLDAIQNLGVMDILCTDKTGTLTQDKIVLKRHLNIMGLEDVAVLEFAYLNSYYQTGLKNLLDVAILQHIDVHQDLDAEKNYRKVDEIPFDFERRRMSVIVEEREHHHELICKGAVEEVLQVSTQARMGDKTVALDQQLAQKIADLKRLLSEDGFRVVAVAYKETPLDQKIYTVKDERDLILMGFIAFLDPPKDSAGAALKALNGHGVQIKVLTGDNEVISRKTCKDVGLLVENVLLGQDIEKLSDDELAKVSLTTNLFAKLSPLQKVRIIEALRKANHVVGFLGDGINDAAALKAADVGISVDEATDIAKEAADIILLEKSLLVLDQGVVAGRKTFANIMKYIKMGTSSNFGNMFSVLGASALLPFLPMQPVQILVNNLLYDFSQTGIPFDNVDEEDLSQPRKWDLGNIKRFMFFIGPISSIFDFWTFFVMWFVFGAQRADKQALFQTGWFVESLLTQTLIVHIIRTPKIPILQSRSSLSMTLITLAVMAIGVALPFTPLGAGLGFVPLPAVYFLWLGLILVCYCVLTQFIKAWFVRKYG